MFHGVDRDIAFYSLSILNAASVFGRTIPNVRCLSLELTICVTLTVINTQYFADSYGALTVLVVSFESPL